MRKMLGSTMTSVAWPRSPRQGEQLQLFYHINGASACRTLKTTW